MSRRREDAILIRGTTLCLVIPRQGRLFYVRPQDGAIGRRKGDTMFWHIVQESDPDRLTTELVGEEVLALDRVVARLAAAIESFQARC